MFEVVSQAININGGNWQKSHTENDINQCNQKIASLFCSASTSPFLVVLVGLSGLFGLTYTACHVGLSRWTLLIYMASLTGRGQLWITLIWFPLPWCALFPTSFDSFASIESEFFFLFILASSISCTFSFSAHLDFHVGWWLTLITLWTSFFVISYNLPALVVTVLLYDPTIPVVLSSHR